MSMWVCVPATNWWPVQGVPRLHLTLLLQQHLNVLNIDGWLNRWMIGWMEYSIWVLRSKSQNKMLPEIVGSIALFSCCFFFFCSWLNFFFLFHFRLFLFYIRLPKGCDLIFFSALCYFPVLFFHIGKVIFDFLIDISSSPFVRVLTNGM